MTARALELRLLRFRESILAELQEEIAAQVAEQTEPLRLELADLERRVTDTHTAALKVATDNISRR